MLLGKKENERKENEKKMISFICLDRKMREKKTNVTLMIILFYK